MPVPPSTTLAVAKPIVTGSAETRKVSQRNYGKLRDLTCNDDSNDSDTHENGEFCGHISLFALFSLRICAVATIYEGDIQLCGNKAALLLVPCGTLRRSGHCKIFT